MSTAKTETSLIISDIIQCSICLDIFKEPKVLPCIHTFCLQCLDTYCETKEEDQTENMTSCPLCRKVFTLPPGGVENLPNNFFIHQLLQVNQSTVTTEESASMKPTSLDQVVPKYERPNLAAERVMTEKYCDQHPRELNSLFCYDCKMITCPMCISQHNQHKLSDVNESANEFKEQMKDDTDNVSACANKKQEEIEQLITGKNHFIEKVASTESKISQKYDELILLLQSHKGKLLEELNEFKRKGLKQIETKKYEVESQWVIMKSYNTYCLNFFYRGSPSDICRMAYDLHTKAEELLMTRDESIGNLMNGVEIKFTPSLSMADSVQNVIGELNCTVEDESRLIARSFLDNTRLHGIIPGGGAIRGLTVLDSQLFVVLDGSTQVKVFDTNNLTLTRDIPIHDSSRLRAIIASPRYNCLYISDIGRRVVYRYNLSDNVMSNWSVGGLCCGLLSLTSTDNVLVTPWNTKQIREYTPDGSLLREIRLDSGIDVPRHSVQLSSGRFVVSHSVRGGSLHRVCMVDTNGRIIKCYGWSKGSGVGQLNAPRYISVDEHDNVLVADCGNHRIELLSPSLAHLGYITIPGYTLSYPWALHLDLLTRRLYIGENTRTGRVFVLTV